MSWLSDLVHPKPDTTVELQRLAKLHNLIDKAKGQAQHVKINYSYHADYQSVVAELESARSRVANRMRALQHPR